MSTFYDKQEVIRKSLNRALDYYFVVGSMGDELYVQSSLDLFVQDTFYKVDEWARSNHFRWSVVHELDHVLIHLTPLHTL